MCCENITKKIVYTALSYSTTTFHYNFLLLLSSIAWISLQVFILLGAFQAFLLILSFFLFQFHHFLISAVADQCIITFMQFAYSSAVSSTCVELFFYCLVHFYSQKWTFHKSLDVLFFNSITFWLWWFMHFFTHTYNLMLEY